MPLDLDQNIAKEQWLGLMLGNSRLHWAYFQGTTLLRNGHGQQISSLDWEQLHRGCPLYLASVVPQQIAPWQTRFKTRLLTLADIPLKNLYPTLGIDRGLASWGASLVYGAPCLVIDAGTALTLTAIDVHQGFWGGAILPGLALQWSALHQHTGALPQISCPDRLPQRWALNTQEALAAGVIYTVLAGLDDYIEQWLCHFPQGRILLTGGDGEVLERYLREQAYPWVESLKQDENLIFWGMRGVFLQNLA
jgi:type III pantothenate kinase